MPVGGGDDQSTMASPARHSRRVIPFWILQGTEILSVFGLADLSLHVSRGGLLIGVGVAFLLLALTADGPFGIVRIFRRKVHTMLVMVAAVIAALLPIAPMLRPDVEGIIILEFVAVGFIRLATLVNTDPRPVRADGSRGSGSIVDAMANMGRPSAPSRPGGISNPPEAGSRPPTVTSVGAAARWAGRATGAATVAASRSAAKHGPVAKSQAKRTIRGAGRVAGKAGYRPGGRSGGPAPTPH